MKNNLRNLCLLLAVVGVGCLTLGLALLSNLAGTRLSLESQPVLTEKAVAAAGLQDIKVDTVSTEVTWHPSSDGQFKARLTGQTTGAAPTLIVTRTGGAVTVSVRYPGQPFFPFGHFAGSTRLEIYAPDRRWHAVEIGTVSGDVRLPSLQTDGFRFHSISGELELTRLTAREAAAASTSGDLKVGAFTGEGAFTTVSGRIELACAKLAGRLKIRTTSGEVELDLPSDAKFNFDAHSTSGEITSAFPITIAGRSGERHRLSGTVGGGGPLVEVETVSGNVDLY